MDRLVKVEATELELHFRPSYRCTATFKITSLIHTMPVAVKLSTTRSSSYSFSPDAVTLLPPLSSAVITLVLLPTAAPHIASQPDFLLVGTALAPALRRANSTALRLFFSRPALHVFRDASLPIHLVGPHALRYLLLPGGGSTSTLLSRVIPSCSPPELSAALLLAASDSAGGNAVSALLSAGVDPNSRDANGKTAISLAVSAGCAESVKALIMAGATDRPLHEAAAGNRTDLIILLLAESELGPDWADKANSEGRTLVHAAAAGGSLYTLRLCLSCGGDPERADARGWTPLHCAAAGGHLEAADLLIKCSNFDPRRALTREGKWRARRRTALDIAVEKGHPHLYEILRPGDELIRAVRCGAGGKVAAEGQAEEMEHNGWTAQHVAAFKGRVEAVRELVEGGAEMEAVDEIGYTPLRCAVEAGDAEVALWLIGRGARAGLKGLIKTNEAVLVSACLDQPVWEFYGEAVSAAVVKTQKILECNKKEAN